MAQAPDLSDLFGKQSTPETPNTGSSPIGDLFGGSPSSVQNTPPTESVSPSSSSIGDLFGTPSPNNGQTTSEAPKFDYQDPNKPWYSRVFSWLNTLSTRVCFLSCAHTLLSAIRLQQIYEDTTCLSEHQILFLLHFQRFSCI